MKKKEFIFSLMLAMILAVVSAPAFAAESGAKSIDDILSVESDTEGEMIGLNGNETNTENEVIDFSDITGYRQSNDLLDTRKFYEMLDSIDNDALQKLKWEVPTAVDSIAVLNVEYDQLVFSFKEAGYGTIYQLEIPEFNVGYSESIVEEFHNTFGDLSGKFNLDASLPSGWSMSELMANAAGNRDALNDFKNSAMYQNVVGNISIGSVFAQASQTLSMPALESEYSLSSRLNSLSTSGLSSWESTKAADFQTIENMASANMNSLKPGLSEELQAIYKLSCTESQSQINSQKKSIAELKDQLINSTQGTTYGEILSHLQDSASR